MNDNLKKAKQIADQAAAQMGKLVSRKEWLGPNGFRYTPYSLKKLELVGEVPSFLSEGFSGLFQRKHKNYKETHQLFLRTVMMVFVNMGLKPYISHHKIHATMEAHGVEITRMTVSLWMNRLVEMGMLSVDKSKSTGGAGKVKASHKACERVSHTYEITNDELKKWTASETLRILGPQLEDGKRYTTNVQLSYVIANSDEKDHGWQIANIPGIFSLGRKGECRLAEMERMVKCAAEKLASMHPQFMFPWMLDDGVTVVTSSCGKYQTYFSAEGTILGVYEDDYAIAEEGEITEKYVDVLEFRDTFYKSKLERMIQRAAKAA
jgi:predicted transcriptional regulator